MINMASLGKVLYEKDNVYIHINVGDSKDKDAYIPGRMYLTEKTNCIFIEWKAEEVTTLDGTSDQEWAVINAVGYKPEKDSETVTVNTHSETRKKYNISFDLDELKSFKTNTYSGLNCNYLIFILKDGTTYPALHFHVGGTKEFCTLLQSYVPLKRSTNDPKLWIIEAHDSDMLSKSFDELHLFAETSGDLVSGGNGQLGKILATKFIKDPYTTTMGGFSKVTNILRDVLFQSEATVSRPKEEVAEMLQEDIFGMEINHQDEPGFELITKTKLPARPKVDRQESFSAEDWAKHMDGDGRIKDLQKLKEAVFRGGIEPSPRVEVWKFLLGYYEWNSTYKTRGEERKRKVDDYFRMKLQWKTISSEQEKRFSLLRERKGLIDKDVTRTDRNHKFFEGDGNRNLQVLNDILMTYCMYNFDLGYVQGMSDLLSPILVVMENEVDAFWCFAGWMEMVCHNFEMDQQGMKTQLAQMHTLMHFVDPVLCSYLESHDSGNFYFCFRWLLIMFKREFSFPDIQRLWEVLWTGKPCKNYHLLICLAILDTEKATLMENKFGFTEILKHINDMSFSIKLEETLKKAEGIYLQLKNVKKLPQPIKEMLGINLSSSGSNSSSNGSAPATRESSPKLELPLHLIKDSESNIPSSGSGTGRTTPDDSSIEILPNNSETGLSNFYY